MALQSAKGGYFPPVQQHVSLWITGISEHLSSENSPQTAPVLSLHPKILSIHRLKVKRLHYLFPVTMWEARNLAGRHIHSFSCSHTWLVIAWQSHAVSLEQTLEPPRQNTALAISLGNKIDTIRPTPSPWGTYSCLDSLCDLCLPDTQDNLLLVGALWCPLRATLPAGVGLENQASHTHGHNDWSENGHRSWSHWDWVSGLSLEQSGRRHSLGLEVSEKIGYRRRVAGSRFATMR